MSDPTLAQAPYDPCPACGYPLERTDSTDSPPTDRCRRCPGVLFTGPGGATVTTQVGLLPLELLRGLAGYFAAALELVTHREFFGRLKAPILRNAIAVAVLGAAGYWLLWPAANGLADLIAGIGDRIGIRGFLWSDTGLRLGMVAVLTLAISPGLLLGLTRGAIEDLAVIVDTRSGLRASATPTPPPERSFGAEWLDWLWLQLWILPVALVLGASPWTAWIGWLAASFLNGALWLSLPMRRRGFDLDERLRAAHDNAGRVTGFGIALGLGGIVPVLNFFLLAPAGAVAATAAYHRMEKDRWSRLQSPDSAPAWAGNAP